MDPPPTNSRTAEVYGGVSWSKDCMATSNRADAILLARLLALHTPLQTPCVPFAKRSRRRSNTGYGSAPGSMQLDRTSLERPSPPLKALTTYPERVLALG